MMRTLLKTLWINPVVFLVMCHPGFAQEQLIYEQSTPPAIDRLASLHERFVYNVRYGFLNLGEVEVHVTPDTVWNGLDVFHLRTIMRANSRIPFVGHQEIHYQSFSAYSDEWPYSFLFWRDDVAEEIYYEYRVEFDRELNEVRFFEEGEPADTLTLEEPASGGDIIFMYGRTFAGTGIPFEIPVYIEDRKGSVQVENSTETEYRRYDAFPEPIETYYSEGEADVDGPFGFRGSFKAWFATDDFRIPLEAHVRIIFGNVRIRLIEYERYE